MRRLISNPPLLATVISTFALGFSVWALVYATAIDSPEKVVSISQWTNWKATNGPGVTVYISSLKLAGIQRIGSCIYVVQQDKKPMLHVSRTNASLERMCHKHIQESPPEPA